MSTRAKFYCNSVTFQGDPNNENTPRTYIFNAVWDPTLPENARFNKATPWGELKMIVSNPAAYPEVGKHYYLDFTLAD